MGCSAPSAMSATRKSCEEARLPRTAAAAAVVSTQSDESKEMSGKCQPERRKTLACVESTPRLATHCTAASCTALLACKSR